MTLQVVNDKYFWCIKILVCFFKCTDFPNFQKDKAKVELLRM